MSDMTPPQSPLAAEGGQVAEELDECWDDMSVLTLELDCVIMIYNGSKQYKPENAPLPNDPTPWKVRIRKLCREFREVFGQFKASREFIDIIANFTVEESIYLCWALNSEWLNWDDNQAGPSKLKQYDDECRELMPILHDITELLDHPQPGEKVRNEEDAQRRWLDVMLYLPRPPNFLLKQAARRIEMKLSEVKLDIKSLQRKVGHNSDEAEASVELVV